MNFKKCLLPLKLNKSVYEETKMFNVHITKNVGWLAWFTHLNTQSVWG